ncbi:uncharacterized protein B0H18DRAFT_983368 [Fomitopsis serialis]|uniref:uncharacterized protein n=1 Tax=Fomitopsis serialis TaxID=139415 RepID=UPI002008E246|nr:uncharacterized protein B0H18DRAFT_983368 [Neoantrodia serialis]KAH9933374.1 hypothetical protein B0H18DRAFT_983368 [Neoantrodia serialis]
MARAVPPLPSDSESDQDTRASARKEKVPSKDAMDVDEENAEVVDDEVEEEYEIERIMDAKIGMFPGGRMGYLVKWKGYGDEHNSWVDEKDSGNAHELIDDYWAKNKKDKRGNRKSTGAPAGRPSTTKARKSSVVRDESSEAEELRPKKRGRPPKAKREESVDDEVEEVEASTAAARSAPEVDAEGFQSMKQWKTTATWEHIVEKIDTVERADDGRLMIYFSLKNGGRGREDSETCKDKMPRKLLDFYETNLRWRVVPEEA